MKATGRIDRSSNVTYGLRDGLGSTVALADGSGSVVGTYAYDVFGGVRSHTGSSTESTFTGEQNDPNGLEYLRARYYDSATGRFLSRDPLAGGYPYASGNPANMIDPTGLYTICDIHEVYGYMCIDSTQVGLPLCGPDGCHLYQGDGSAPGNIALPILCDLRQLTNGRDGNPDWSDDGKRILFERDRDIYVMDADGANVRPYFDKRTMPAELHNTSTFPAWAPGSHRIAFISLGGLYIAGGEMSAPRVVPTGNLRVLYGAVAWSPNGSRILFGADGGMYVVQGNGKNLDKISASLTGDGEVSWTT